jgi:DNA-directed RNA polymerase specialized sigma24 family protein
MIPKLINLSVGKLSESQLLSHPNIKPQLRYDTYIRVGDVLLTTMFRETIRFKSVSKLISMESLLLFIKHRISFSSIALRNGNSIRPSQFNQPLAGMGIVTLEDLASDVLIKILRQEPKIITLAYLDMTIKCIGIDAKRKAVLRHTESVNRVFLNNSEDEYEWSMVDKFSATPEDSLVFERLIKELSPVEQKVLLGLLGNSDGQSLADDIGIHRRTVYLVKNRIKSLMHKHM